MPIPLIAAAAKGVAAAAKGVAAAAKGVVATAAKGAVAAAAKGAVATAAKGATTAATTAAKGAASSIKPIVTPSLKSVATDKLSLSNISKNEMSKLGSRINVPKKKIGLFDIFDKYKDKLDSSSIKDKAYGLLDYGESESSPSWSEREGNINNITPSGIPMQNQGAFEEQAAYLKNRL